MQQPVLKADAETVVKKVEGVTAVVNKIEVLPPSANDVTVRRPSGALLHRPIPSALSEFSDQAKGCTRSFPVNL